MSDKKHLDFSIDPYKNDVDINVDVISYYIMKKYFIPSDTDIYRFNIEDYLVWLSKHNSDLPYDYFIIMLLNRQKRYKGLSCFCGVYGFCDSFEKYKIGDKLIPFHMLVQKAHYYINEVYKKKPSELTDEQIKRACVISSRDIDTYVTDIRNSHETKVTKKKQQALVDEFDESFNDNRCPNIEVLKDDSYYDDNIKCSSKHLSSIVDSVISIVYIISTKGVEDKLNVSACFYSNSSLFKEKGYCYAFCLSIKEEMNKQKIYIEDEN